MGVFRRRRPRDDDVPGCEVRLGSDGRYAEGLPWSEHAWQVGNANAGFNPGAFAQMRGHLNRAEAVWNQLATVGDADAMPGLARLALQRGDHDQASRWIEPIRSNGDAFAVTALGVAFRDSGDEDTGLRLSHDSLARGDPYAMDYAARIYDSRGEADRAALLRSRADDLRTVPANRQPPLLGL